MIKTRKKISINDAKTFDAFIRFANENLEQWHNEGKSLDKIVFWFIVWAKINEGDASIEDPRLEILAEIIGEQTPVIRRRFRFTVKKVNVEKKAKWANAVGLAATNSFPANKDTAYNLLASVAWNLAKISNNDFELPVADVQDLLVYQKQAAYDLINEMIEDGLISVVKNHNSYKKTCRVFCWNGLIEESVITPLSSANKDVEPGETMLDYMKTLPGWCYYNRNNEKQLVFESEGLTYNQAVNSPTYLGKLGFRLNDDFGISVVHMKGNHRVPGLGNISESAAVILNRYNGAAFPDDKETGIYIFVKSNYDKSRYSRSQGRDLHIYGGHNACALGGDCIKEGTVKDQTRAMFALADELGKNE